MIVNAIDTESANDAARMIKASAEALNVWQGLGDPVPYEAPATGPYTFDLAVAEGPGRALLSSISPPWALAMQQDHQTAMTLELRGHDPGGGAGLVRCTVSLSSHGRGAVMIATLLAADPAGPVRLQAIPRARHADQPPELSLPLSMAARLVGSPARIDEGWPAQPVQPPDRLIELVEQATPPHSALFGGSGQGKTTLMEHLVDSSLDAGNTVVVVCPHGDLAGRAATLAKRHGARFAALDFGDRKHCPSWNLCIPPPGTSPTQWAAELVGVVQAAWHDRPSEFFGPVWNKSMRVALSVLTRDPRGPHPLTEVTSVPEAPAPSAGKPRVAPPRRSGPDPSGTRSRLILSRISQSNPLPTPTQEEEKQVIKAFFTIYIMRLFFRRIVLITVLFILLTYACGKAYVPDPDFPAEPVSNSEPRAASTPADA